MKNKFNITKQELEKLYIVEDKSTKEIAKILNLNYCTINLWLHKLNIPIKHIREYDLIGKKIGRWNIISKIPDTNKHRTKWLCKCDCGKEKIILQQSLINSSSQSCGCLKRELLWQGCGELPMYYFNTTKNRARKLQIEFNISIEYLWNLFLQQDRKCALSGVEICFTQKWKKRGEQTASIDRIDSSKGYIEGNVQWVHKDVNYMKQEYSMEYFLHWVKQIYLTSVGNHAKLSSKQ